MLYTDLAELEWFYFYRKFLELWSFAITVSLILLKSIITR